ncbi:acyltransferase [Paractinoplanes durhamensis]|uniref:Acyltransferase n=1 Tax=Paractinoplanes durhamensis TaxID=113563 RepID=A0ABQ3Z790_9ACTN|nr:acyltransferase [Actinoplanes durhamensis]
MTATVRAGEAGPRIGAFFGFDGTLVRGRTTPGVRRDRTGNDDIGALRGRTMHAVTEAGEQQFVQRISGTMRPESRDLVRCHLSMGHTVVVASSATRAQIAPVARDLGVPHVVCTELEEEDGVLTGRSTTGVRCGTRKAEAVRAFARDHDVDLGRSYAYAGGPEDVAFLGSVGRPYALNPHPALRRAAGEFGWPELTLREPRSPNLRACLGTIGGLIGVNAGLATGFACGWLTGDHRLGVNVGVGLSADLGLALTGVTLNVTGEENLARARPAVFVANHQSTLDVLVLAALLRHDFTAVAKQEARLDPRMLVIEAVLDPVFIDRSDLNRAKASLDGAVRRLRDGVSILILPEGTRMPTPTLGRFKKGAFHIALQAQVPIVPIVLRNTGELAWRRSLFVNPGTVDVAVLDPSPTTGWAAEDLDSHIAEVRQRIADTLENWPGR